LKGYIGRHWRGEQNVVWSLLVNCIALYVAMIGGGAALVAYAGVPDYALALGIPILLAWSAWAVIGTLRAALATLRDQHSPLVLKLTAVLTFAALALVLVVLVYHDLPIVRRWLVG
jgi:hypothetical protein